MKENKPNSQIAAFIEELGVYLMLTTRIFEKHVRKYKKKWKPALGQQGHK